MEKLSARWGCGLLVGVKVKSNELIIVDQRHEDAEVREDCPTTARKSTMGPGEFCMGGWRWCHGIGDKVTEMQTETCPSST